MKNQAANNGTFIPKPGFTVVQNSVARDWNLSSGALGLYTRIQSYITMESIALTKGIFMERVPEGEYAFNTAWNELKSKGYLFIHGQALPLTSSTPSAVLPRHTRRSKMSTDYTNVNGYLIPSFALPTGSTPPLGKYGAMRARFLDEHRPFERDQMLLDGTLAQHLAGVDSEAHNQVSALVRRLAEQRGVTEDLKRHRPLKWAAHMQALGS